MRTRKIAVVGLKDDAAQAFRSMLKIVDGRARAAWSLSGAEDADVLMAGVDAAAPEAERWALTDKPLIAVHEGESRPMTPFSLRHPFRVMQLLGVLDEVERSLEAAAPACVAPAPAAASAPWAFVESLRRLSRHAGNGAWQCAGEGAETVFVRDDLGMACASPAAWTRLERGGLPLPALRPTHAAVPATHLPRPIFDLAWFAGLHEPAGLAPWLDPHGRFHLRRWPDFGRVRGPRSQLALAALLARRDWGREELASAAAQSQAEVDRFLNACAATGLLAPGAAAAAAAPAAPGLGGLIQRLRRHLGLAA